MSEEASISSPTIYEFFLVDFVAGGVAGAVSRTVVSPFERLKIIFQLNTQKVPSMWRTLSGIWNNEGLIGMFRGNGTNVIRIFPYSAVQFASYETAKKRMSAGAFAGICSVTATYPLDLIRTRLSIQNLPSEGIFKCGKEIFQKEGGVFALYRGLFPTLAGIAPYVALNFTLYEGSKSWAKGSRHDLNVFVKLCCGGFAGAVAQTVTYPFDVVRRRMQIANSPNLAANYSGSLDVVKKIFKYEGIRGFYKGIVPNYIKVVPAISISFVTFEHVRKVVTQ